MGAAVRVAAFIPARGGSKRIERKNLADVGGSSLLARAIRSAEEACSWIVVSSDDAEIRCVAREEGADEMHARPPALASDHAQIETAISHWYTRLDEKPDVIVLLQPTSPFRTAAHVRAAIDMLATITLDSVVGVVQSHHPHFAGRLKPRETPDETTASTHSHGVPFFEWQPFAPAGDRPRTQDLAPRGHECGAIYAFTRSWWERSGQRMGGRMAALPLTWIEGLDIDTPEDLEACRAIAAGMGI